MTEKYFALRYLIEFKIIPIIFLIVLLIIVIAFIFRRIALFWKRRMDEENERYWND